MPALFKSLFIFQTAFVRLFPINKPMLSITKKLHLPKPWYSELIPHNFGEGEDEENMQNGFRIDTTQWASKWALYPTLFQVLSRKDPTVQHCPT